MQKSGQGQSQNNFRLSGTTNNCTFGPEIHSRLRAKPTKVLATPIQHTTAVSSNAVIFPSADSLSVSSLRKFSPRFSHGNRDPAGHTHGRPDCSYTLLIAMALKSSKSGALPVNEIYKYIQRKFPYFQAVSETCMWKNSVRHSLSLGRFFRKVERTGTKRGFYWEVVPGKKAALDKELERFMREEGLVINGSTENEASDEVTSKQPQTVAVTASISPPSQKTSQEPESVMISPPSKNSSLKQASATQNQQKHPPEQRSEALHNTSLANDTFIASNVAINKAIFSPLSGGLQPSSSATSTFPDSTSKMTYQKLPVSSVIPMDYIIMKTLAEGRQTSEPSVGTDQDQFHIQPQQSTLSLASGLEVTTPTSPWPDLPEELLSILPQCPSVAGENSDMPDLEPGLEKCAADCDCSTCKVWTPALLQHSGEQILPSGVNRPSSTSHQIGYKKQPTVVIDLTSPVLTSTRHKCQDPAATLSIKPTKPIPLELQYYNTNLQVHFANSSTCAPLPVNVCEPASIQADHMVSAGRTAINLEKLVDTCSLQNSVFQVEKLDEQKKGANQVNSQHQDFLTCMIGELHTSTSSGMLNSQQKSGSRHATSSSHSAAFISSTKHAPYPQRVSPLSALENLANLSIDELVKLVEEEEYAQRQRMVVVKEENRKEMVQSTGNVSLASIRGAPVVSRPEESRSNIPSATNFKLPVEQNFKKRRLEEEHNYCANINRGFSKPKQTKKSTDANNVDCSKWRDPAYTEEWIDHPLSTENMLALLEGMEQTEAKRGSSARTGVTGMSVPAIAAGLPTTLEKVQESLDEGNVEAEGQ